jgi:catechol 2,3-dioxygenase-like lactoylglutathione lyase family enzyme
MFADTKAYSGFAVDNLEAAKRFYGQTLGLRVSELDPGNLLTLHLAGGRDTLIYIKPDHTPATYTILNFPVDDIEAAVAALRAAGVEFEHYDEGPIKTNELGIATPGPKQAWFRDPAGNILSVIQG